MISDFDLAQRYRWFCLMGWNKPVLNDPLVVRGEATPNYIDKLIQEGMSRWPIRESTPTPPTKEAA